MVTTDCTTITDEVGCLAAEIFSTTEGMTWTEAVREAVNCFVDLRDYAAEWDRQQLFTAPLRGDVPKMDEDVDTAVHVDRYAAARSMDALFPRR